MVSGGNDPLAITKPCKIGRRFTTGERNGGLKDYFSWGYYGRFHKLKPRPLKRIYKESD